MNKWLISLSIAAALANPAAQAAGDAAAGKEKSAVCAGCHNADGNSVNPLWPKIAGQHPGYIVQQLQDYKSGARQDPVMAPMAMPLSDEDMVNLATWVSACAACHAPNGVGNPAANFPALAGQHATYVEKALKEFRAGTRNNDNAQMMQNVAARMTDDEIAAVAQYIQGLR